jgi:prepilin-type N-terminal cleavage/methylation domain-containing protein
MTLIELIIAMVVVGICIVAALSFMSSLSMRSGSSMTRRSRPPNLDKRFLADGREATRDKYDDVLDVRNEFAEAERGWARDRGEGESLPPAQGYDVILRRNSVNPAPVVNGVVVNVFLATATATRGQYGSPEFVSRQRPARITP